MHRGWMVAGWVIGCAAGGCGPSGSAKDYGDFDGFEWDHDWTASGDSGVELVGDDATEAVGAAADSCWDEDIGSDVGTNVGGGDQRAGSNVYDCNGGTGREWVVRWTPPESGRYTISTLGSPSDTVLEVRRGCEGEMLACNDDYVGLASQVSVSVEAGEEIVIIADSYSSYDEDYVTVSID